MKILLAIDGSPCSETAVAEVARRPWPDDSQLRIISVVEPPGALTAEPYMGVGGYFEEVERLKKQQAEEILAQASEVLRAGAGTAQLGLATEALTGSPKRTIVEEAEAWGADLIVVGSHRPTMATYLLGSNATAIVRHAKCSVLVLRNDGQPQPRPAAAE